ncbi:nuclease-related domain-containing protein [Tranquillimonas alkanivorans]|uniref:Nuclease-related domain-containing protein n=1 Tax=Tranquillimonas alkanivorans TaxID=441119 RepID=A0A1I5W3C0_9RHOB|nr:nuclease-related domain-containing protein [Tranquillimonas alkanivorans]SFQ14225.1 Nuclease-related domain-containing protein [Tranquillimonas alkanivorans]
MKITNCGSGLHPREVKCAATLKENLPRSWYAYTNLDLVLGRGMTREVDLVIVADHYVFVADVKDWYGKVESDGGNWIQNGQDRGASPVKKITEIKRKVYEKLQGHLKSRRETRGLAVPAVHGIVLMSGEADISAISDMERDSVFSLDQFVRAANAKEGLRRFFGNVPYQHVSSDFSGDPWKQILTRFFNVKSNGVFEPGRRRFNGFVTEGGATFKHPGQVYTEYEAHEERVPRNTATLRLWDFAHCENAHYQTEEGRMEIAGRERNIFHWLRDRNSFAEKYILNPVAHDVESSVEYWEVFERRPSHKRLSDFLLTELDRLSMGDSEKPRALSGLQ